MHIQVSYGLHQVCVDGVTYLVTEILHHLWNQFPEDVQEHISYVALNYEFHLMELREKQREQEKIIRLAIMFVESRKAEAAKVEEEKKKTP